MKETTRFAACILLGLSDLLERMMLPRYSLLLTLTPDRKMRKRSIIQFSGQLCYWIISAAEFRVVSMAFCVCLYLEMAMSQVTHKLRSSRCKTALEPW